MKRVFCVMIISLLLCGCVNLTPTVQPTANPTSGEQTNPPTAESVYGDGKGIDHLVGIDEFGRTVNVTEAQRDGKQVGMFYWLWHGSYTKKSVVDTSKLIEQYGLDEVLHNAAEMNPDNEPYYWGEPLYGYYHSGDEYIIRKHLTLLMYAGVDFIVFDGTNTITYPSVARKICDIVIEMRNEGFMVPQVAYFTHTSSLDTVRKVYKELYTKEEYSDAWYRVDGKPFIIAYTDAAKDKERTTSQHAHLANYDPEPLSQEILDFFYFRTPVWVGVDPVLQDGWPWVDWTFPPALYGDVVSVSCASHHNNMFSWGVAPADNKPSFPWAQGQLPWGRGFSFADGKNHTEYAAQGKFYQAVWNTAIERDPAFVFVGGWNEWMCGGNESYNEEFGVYQWYDSFNMEYSRDAELMKGGYNDAFLVQTAFNIRDYKYTEPQTEYKSPKFTIDINGDAAQWDKVDAVYCCTGTTNYGRDYRGAVPGIEYTSPVPQNSLQKVKIAADDDNIYFLITTDGDIVMRDESSMNLFIGTGTPELKGWEGYEYVLNRGVDGGKTEILKLDAEFNTQSVGKAQVSIKGAYMQISIPRAALGLTDSNALYFKVADSVEQTKDIMDYYVSGRCMPMGRFSYQYLG